jgi:FKBP-type peptidyl-prolyl cis-trans isomerase
MTHVTRAGPNASNRDSVQSSSSSSRREALALTLSGLVALPLIAPGPASALPGFKKDLNKGRKLREKIDKSAFTAGLDGLLYQDIVVGDGPLAQEGSRVAVHFDAKWKGITFVTTRQGMGVTGGSPFGFDVGAPPNMGGTLKGLDLGVRGMRVGGQRRLIVPAKLAYGEKGYGEIPPGAELTVDVALLSIKTNAVGYRVKIVEG